MCVSSTRGRTTFDSSVDNSEQKKEKRKEGERKNYLNISYFLDEIVLLLEKDYPLNLKFQIFREAEG